MRSDSNSLRTRRGASRILAISFIILIALAFVAVGAEVNLLERPAVTHSYTVTNFVTDSPVIVGAIPTNQTVSTTVTNYFFCYATAIQKFNMTIQFVNKLNGSAVPNLNATIFDANLTALTYSISDNSGASLFKGLVNGQYYYNYTNPIGLTTITGKGVVEICNGDETITVQV